MDTDIKKSNDDYILVNVGDIDLLMAMAYEFEEYLVSIKNSESFIIKNNLDILVSMMDEFYYSLASIKSSSKFILCRRPLRWSKECSKTRPK